LATPLDTPFRGEGPHINSFARATTLLHLLVDWQASQVDVAVDTEYNPHSQPHLQPN